MRLIIFLFVVLFSINSSFAAGLIMSSKVNRLDRIADVLIVPQPLKKSYNVYAIINESRRYKFLFTSYADASAFKNDLLSEKNYRFVVSQDNQGYSILNEVQTQKN